MIYTRSQLGKLSNKECYMDYIKIDERKIKVERVTINTLNATMTISCPIESYMIFKQWMEITKAHKNSNDYSKSNIVRIISIDGIKYYGCQICRCDNHDNVVILFDYHSASSDFTVLDKQETLDELNKLFS